jgi:tetratricopeptide (TPR) repeat protein
MRRNTLAIIAALVVGAVGCASKEKTGMKIYVQQKLYDKAIEQGAKALAQNENDGDTHYFMGAAYYGKDEALAEGAPHYVDSCAAWLAQAFDHFTKAKRLAEASWGVASDDNIVAMYGRHFNRGVSKMKSGDFKGAADEFKLATVADPDNYQAYYQHAQALLGMANAAKKLDRQDEFMSLTETVVQDLDKVLAIDPRDKDVTVTVYQAKGEVLFGRGDLAGAQEAYKKAAALSPENYTLLLTMADRFYNAQEWEAAAGYYGDALSIKERLNLIDKKDVPVYAARGSCLAKLNRRAEAIDAFEKALALDPSDTGSLYNLMVTRYKAGEEAEKSGDMATAKQFYSQAIPLGDQLIGIEPARPEYWQVRGLCKRGVGDFAGAARDLKEYQDLKGGTSGQ